MEVARWRRRRGWPQPFPWAPPAWVAALALFLNVSNRFILRRPPGGAPERTILGGPAVNNCMIIGPAANQCSNIGPAVDACSNIGPAVFQMFEHWCCALLWCVFAHCKCSNIAFACSNIGPAVGACSNIGPAADKCSNIGLALGACLIAARPPGGQPPTGAASPGRALRGRAPFELALGQGEVGPTYSRRLCAFWTASGERGCYAQMVCCVVVCRWRM